MSTLTDIHPSNPHLTLEAEQESETSVAREKTTLSAEDIHRLLPHRYPFALVDRIIDFVETTAIPQAFFSMLQALPNTALSERLQKEGRLLDEKK